LNISDNSKKKQTEFLIFLWFCKITGSNEH